MEILQKVHLVHTMLAFSNLDISKDSESLISLLYRWNSTTHTFFTGCQEVSLYLEDVYEILRLPLFGDREMANISLSTDETKAVKFLVTACCDNSGISGVMTLKSPGGVFAVLVFPIRKQITVLIYFLLHSIIGDLFVLPRICMLI